MVQVQMAWEFAQKKTMLCLDNSQPRPPSTCTNYPETNPETKQNTSQGSKPSTWLEMGYRPMKLKFHRYTARWSCPIKLGDVLKPAPSTTLHSPSAVITLSAVYTLVRMEACSCKQHTRYFICIVIKCLYILLACVPLILLSKAAKKGSNARISSHISKTIYCICLRYGHTF